MRSFKCSLSVAVLLAGAACSSQQIPQQTLAPASTNASRFQGTFKATDGTSHTFPKNNRMPSIFIFGGPTCIPCHVEGKEIVAELSGATTIQVNLHTYLINGETIDNQNYFRSRIPGMNWPVLVPSVSSEKPDFFKDYCPIDNPPCTLAFHADGTLAGQWDKVTLSQLKKALNLSSLR